MDLAVCSKWGMTEVFEVKLVQAYQPSWTSFGDAILVRIDMEPHCTKMHEFNNNELEKSLKRKDIDDFMGFLDDADVAFKQGSLLSFF